ncbi:MAG: CRTAC1 family protein [Planctomycetes bacterium]|nr:CRTAC1 family protein [Planctomycetota bacterium]
MRAGRFILALAVCTFSFGKPAVAGPPEGEFVFRDVGKETGLLPAAAGIMGHAAGWGDADGDGWIDLYVATFDQIEGQTRPNMLFFNRQGRFEKADQTALAISTRATGSVFADLDNDGDLDLYVSSMPGPEGTGLAKRFGHAFRGCTLFRNEGQGRYTNISEGNGACPDGFGGRSACVFDYDGDGLLDLLVGEDPFPGYNGSKTKSSRLFRNVGGLQFEDASRKVELPEGIPGLGVAAADLNGDTRPDFFLASSAGGNRLFLNNGDGTFREAPGSPEVFQWEGTGGDNMICGVAFGDVNADGRLDMVVGQHFSTPWLEPVPIRLYLNRGGSGGDVLFEDVTKQAGLIPLPLKAPHVEIQDFDNDGRPDIYTSLVKFADGRPHPLIFRNESGSASGGVPRFVERTMAVNDFPTDAHRAIRGSGPFFEHIVREGKVIYMAPGPSGDFDNDGRLDLFLANWWPESPSLLLKNETPGGRWLQVTVAGRGDVNRMGVGSRINVYRAGGLGEAKELLGVREIAVGYGYASAQPAIAHFGLGDAEKVDVEILLPHGKGSVTQAGVETNRRVAISAP